MEAGEVIEFAGSVAEGLDGDAGEVEQGEVEVGHRGFGGVGDVAAAAEFRAGDQRGEVVVVVGVGVADGGAVDDEGVVEKRGAAFFGGLEFIEAVGELFDVEGVDFGHLLDEFGVVAVVGAGVVRFGDAGFRVRLQAAFAGEHEGDDAGGAAQEGEDGKIEQEAGVLTVGGRDAGGRVDGGGGRGVD